MCIMVLSKQARRRLGCRADTGGPVPGCPCAATAAGETGSLLAVGAVLGGIAGNALFQMLKGMVGQNSSVGMVQAVVLTLATLLTLVYSLICCYNAWRFAG